MALDLALLQNNVGVRAVDDKTLVITLVKRAAYFPSIAALWIGAPTRSTDTHTGEWWKDQATFVGNGPFVLEKWDATEIQWKRNPYYVGPLGPVQIAGLNYRVIESTTTELEAYKNNELDVLQIASSYSRLLANDARFGQQRQVGPPATVYYLSLNQTIKPLDDIRVRQAFAQAIDREALVRELVIGEPAYTFMPPTSDTKEQQWKFDLTASRTLLAEAGYPEGKNFPRLQFPYPAGGKNDKIYEWIAYHLQQNLGIQVELRPLEGTVYASLYAQPSTIPAIALDGWVPDFIDPQNYYSTVFRTGGFTTGTIGYSNKQFDTLVDQADQELAVAKRQTLYDRASKLLLSDTPVIFLWYGQRSYLIQPHVRGISLSMLDVEGFPGFYALAKVRIGE